jgi:hypothetical protein
MQQSSLKVSIIVHVQGKQSAKCAYRAGSSNFVLQEPVLNSL